ncbi:MAG: YceD family protein [Thermoleophilaceae bacterium]
MAGRTDIFDLGPLHLASGEGRRLELETGFDALALGGQRYALVRDRVPVVLDVARTTSGWALRLRFDARLVGPCMRCLEPAERTWTIDAREVDQPGGGDDLTSPYVDGDELDLSAWARDALALDLSGQVLCRDDCAGLCPACGENLNERPHEHERATDPRWAKLSELKLK